MKVEFTLNNEHQELEADPVMPLLWALRDLLGLQGTKFGCGIGQCGACTVHLDGAAIRSCVLPVVALTGRSVTTIEGLGEGDLHPLQEAWLEEESFQVSVGDPQNATATESVMLVLVPSEVREADRDDS